MVFLFLYVEESGMINRKSLVSIIVPVYQVELYIKQCIESILNQTYAKIEVILVEDGSPDGCSEICDIYAQKDSRIQVIHKKNEGANYARRSGLDIAQGEYCLFVDGDDWIDPVTVEQCVATAQKDQCDCVLFSYVREYCDKSIKNPLFEESFHYNLTQSDELVYRRLIGPLKEELAMPHRVDNLSSMCMKLYRIEVARKGRIVSEKIVGTSEDTLFNLYALNQCKISYLNQCFYHYRRGNIHSITTGFKENLAEKWDCMYQIFQEFLEESGRMDTCRTAFLNRVACGMIGLGLNQIGDKKGIVKQGQCLKTILMKPLYREAFSQLDLSYCPFKWKIFFMLCKMRAGRLLAILLKIIQYMRSHVME